MYIINDNKDPYFTKIFSKLKQLCKKPSFYLKSGIAIFLLGVLIFNLNSFSQSLNLGDFSFSKFDSENLAQSSAQELFAESAKNFLRESPEISIVQGNSLKGISSPTTITSKVLGAILGGVETNIGIQEREEITEYIVEPKDTLSSIAEDFNVSLNTILWANDLSKSSVINAGQKLVILPVSGTIHFVKGGDTLGGIAQTYKGDIDEIVDFNGLLAEEDIFIGDVVIVPDGTMPSRIPSIALTPFTQSYFIFPCEGIITQGLHPLNAVDIANSCGKPIVASAGGIVQRASWFNNIYGNGITILHPNGVVTCYAHLSRILVASGSTVSAGDIIGYIGHTGHTIGATGCHLHFEVRNAKNFLSDYAMGAKISWKK
ncbi:MAG: M23 family metallopeptidase [Patescibacteria group bacterium]|nr:M23 family metallopeptidase [Patescibacteria group bacterium]